MTINHDALDVSDLLRDARNVSGLEDFGPTAFLEGLECYLDSLKRESGLPPAGLAMKRQQLVTMLANRLRANRIARDYPEVLEQDISCPLFIIGPPRTGTTKLQRMIASDPSLAFLRLWQSRNPVPHEGTQIQDPDPRYEEARARAEQMLKETPEMFASHTYYPDDPEEEVWILEHTFLNKMMHIDVYVPSYMEWLRRQDVTRCFEELRDYFKIVQWQNKEVGKPWIIKCVLYNEDIDTVLKIFPNAKFVCSHRNITEQMPSWCQLILDGRRLFKPDFDAQLHGTDQLEQIAVDMENHIALRKSMPADRIMDIAYKDVVSDAIGTIKKIYSFRGWQWTEQAEQLMKTWEKNNRQYKHGKRDYDLSTFGLSEERINERFAFYSEYFAAYL